mmetsp:Transcript_32082/g.125050  ORF Transcript_32082/g.125050 Transcript_32082/m.125050 type:complete len:244 (+) Transcript_32082:329-1060(+)
MAIHIGIGTYDGSVCGLGLNPSESAELELQYGYTPHSGTVRDIVVDGSMMMSAGVDDFIRIYNVQKRKEVGVLVQHNGPVNCLDILHRKYALSGGDDGELCVWRSRDWELLRRLRAHKKPVLDAKFHPSGAAAVTIGGDRKLKLWDIVRAHEAFGTTLENDARQVEWMSKGDRVAIAHGRKISVFETEKGSIFCDMELPKRVLSMAVINRNRIAAVCEGGQIQVQTQLTHAQIEFRMLSISPS